MHPLLLEEWWSFTGQIPDNAMLWPDGEPMLWSDGEYMLWPA